MRRSVMLKSSNLAAVPVMPQPEVYLGAAGTLFGADGALQNEKTKEFLTKFMAAFATWIARNRDP